MTRYTNLGFKRKYLQAGFDDAEDKGAEDVVVAENGLDSAESVPNTEPIKKKRKRSKKKGKDIVDGTEVVEGDESAEAGTSSEVKPEEQQLSKRKLYKKQKLKGKHCPLHYEHSPQVCRVQGQDESTQVGIRQPTTVTNTIEAG
jgi:zinc finger CCHC domain-containing protein 9